MSAKNLFVREVEARRKSCPNCKAKKSDMKDQRIFAVGEYIRVNWHNVWDRVCEKCYGQHHKNQLERFRREAGREVEFQSRCGKLPWFLGGPDEPVAATEVPDSGGWRYVDVRSITNPNKWHLTWHGHTTKFAKRLDAIQEGRRIAELYGTQVRIRVNSKVEGYIEPDGKITNADPNDYAGPEDFMDEMLPSNFPVVMSAPTNIWPKERKEDNVPNN